jgi:hypothetical protein
LRASCSSHVPSRYCCPTAKGEDPAIGENMGPACSSTRAVVEISTLAQDEEPACCPTPPLQQHSPTELSAYVTFFLRASCSSHVPSRYCCPIAKGEDPAIGENMGPACSSTRAVVEISTLAQDEEPACCPTPPLQQHSPTELSASEVIQRLFRFDQHGVFLSRRMVVLDEGGNQSIVRLWKEGHRQRARMIG